MSVKDALVSASNRFESAADVTLPRAVVVSAIIILIPLVFGTELGTFVVAFAIAVVGLDILLGYTGYISFGHAAFFGGGAYAAALTTIHLVDSMLAALVVAAIATVVLGIVFGYISLQRSGVYFAMITLALAQVLYFTVRVVPGVRGITGGSDGLTNIPDPQFLFLQPLLGQPLVLESGSFYVFSVVVFVAGIAIARWITNSPYGLVLRTIRENEERTAFLGYDPTWYKLSAFTISGIYAGIGGALIGLNVSAVASESLFWVTSADILIMLIVGGMGTIYGAIFGSTFVLVLEDVLSVQISPEDYRLYLGIIFVFFVFFVPQGLWKLDRETVASARIWLRNKLGRRATE